MKKVMLCACTAVALMLGFGFETEGMECQRFHDIDTTIHSSAITNIFSFKLNETATKFEVQQTGEHLVFKNEELLSTLFSNFRSGERPIVQGDMKRAQVADILINFFGTDKVTFLDGRDLPSYDPFAGLGRVVATKVFFK